MSDDHVEEQPVARNLSKFTYSSFSENILLHIYLSHYKPFLEIRVNSTSSLRSLATILYRPRFHFIFTSSKEIL